MSQVLHIFRKDARHLWPYTAAVLVMIAAHAWIAVLSSPITTLSETARLNSAGSFLALFLPVSLAMLTALLIFQEPLPGDRHFWMSRPYRWPKLLTAKILFLFVFLNVPLFFSDVYILAAQAGLGIAYDLERGSAGDEIPPPVNVQAGVVRIPLRVSGLPAGTLLRGQCQTTIQLPGRNVPRGDWTWRGSVEKTRGQYYQVWFIDEHNFQMFGEAAVTLYTDFALETVTDSVEARMPVTKRWSVAGRRTMPHIPRRRPGANHLQNGAPAGTGNGCARGEPAKRGCGARDFWI